MNQHRLVVDKDVIVGFPSNKDEAPKTTSVHAVLPDVADVGKGQHDDRLDALAQGVKYFTDCMLSQLKRLSTKENVRME